MARLTHLDSKGRARMVDVSAKESTERTATATGRITMSRETFDLVRQRTIEKGDVLSTARLAAIMGAKRTPDLIPLCHPLSLSSVVVDLALVSGKTPAIEITATCKLKGQTGVEMEALTAVCIAALTVYDMCKAVDRSMTIGDIRLVHKAGGKSGEYVASKTARPSARRKAPARKK